MDLTREILSALGAPFPEEEIEFLPRATSGANALAIAYLDARAIMRRLDAVVAGEWSFVWDPIDTAGKMVRGHLSVCGVTRSDAGESSKEEETLKSAVSDALKRCGVHFGIGRYLYYLPGLWAPYDSQKRRFVEHPHLDPRAVARALATCGIETPAPPGLPAPAREEKAETGPTNPGRAPVQGANLTGATCPQCNAPTGKLHTRSCPAVRPT